MNRRLTTAGLTLSGLLILAPSLGAYPRVIVRPSFGYYYGYYPRPFYAKSETLMVLPGRSTGEVKIDSKRKQADVYVDGGFLGTIRKFKSFSLRPGAHDIELRDGGTVIFHEKVAVVPGKTTRIDAE